MGLRSFSDICFSLCKLCICRFTVLDHDDYLSEVSVIKNRYKTLKGDIPSKEKVTFSSSKKKYD